MKTLTATEAARNFSDVLDKIADGESFRITRAGEVVAEFTPARPRTGRDLRATMELLEAEPGRIADDTLEADIANGLSTMSSDWSDPWDAA